MANIIWTDAENELIKRERAKTPPTPTKDIAAMLGRKVPATFNQCRKIKALVQPHAPWTDQQTQMLIDAIRADPTVRDTALETLVGHSTQSVRWKVAELNLTTERRIRTPIVIKPLRVKATKPPKAPVVRTILAAKPKTLVSKTVIARTGAPPATPIVKPKSIAVTAVATPARTRPAAPPKPFDITKAFKKKVDQKPRLKAAKVVKAKVVSISPKKLGVSAPPRLVALACGSSAAVTAQTGIVKTVVLPMITVAAYVPKIETMPEEKKTSGRGGWMVSRNANAILNAKAKKAPPVNANELSMAAADAVARFIAERGVRRPVLTQSEAITAALQRRGYSVVPTAPDTWIIDNRVEITSLNDLKVFAAKRGICENQAHAA